MEQSSSESNNSGDGNNNAGNSGGGDGGSNNQGGSGSGGDGSVWFDSFDPEIKSYIQAKGFQGPQEVAKSNLNLEKLLGGDRESLLRLPKDFSNVEESAPFWKKAGMPDEAKEFIFKTPESLKVDEGEMNKYKQFALETNMTRRQFEPFMEKVFGYLEAKDRSITEAFNTRAKEDKESLEKDWGTSYDDNKNVVQQLVTGQKITDQEWAGIKGQLGDKRAMEIFYNLGKGAKEPDFFGGKVDGSAAQTATDAKTQIKNLMTDTDFLRRQQAGDVEAKRTWDNLHKVAFPGEMTI